MTEKEIEKILKYAARYEMSPMTLGKMLTAPPHSLTPVDATKLMDRYKREFPAHPRVVSPPVSVLEGAAKAPRLLPKSPLPPYTHEELAASLPSAAPSAALINRSAVKKLALAVSKETRAGKFTRVSTEFIDGVEADLDMCIRDLGRSFPREGYSGTKFVTGKAVQNAREMLDKTVEAIVRARVRRHPTMGVTLK